MIEALPSREISTFFVKKLTIIDTLRALTPKAHSCTGSTRSVPPCGINDQNKDMRYLPLFNRRRVLKNANYL